MSFFGDNSYSWSCLHGCLVIPCMLIQVRFMQLRQQSLGLWNPVGGAVLVIKKAGFAGFAVFSSHNEIVNPFRIDCRFLALIR